MEHVAQTYEHIVLKADPWELIDLAPTWHIATLKDFDVYLDREEAIAAIKAQYPDFEPTEWEAPVVPESVSMRQGRLALLQAGLLDQVDAAIASIPDAGQRRAAEIEWEYATMLERTNPLVAAIAHQVGMTDAQMDQLFLQASTL
jgi:hypothetical protein